MQIRRVFPVLAVAALAAAAVAPRTTGDGVYTAAQAAEGAIVFEQVCLACHLPGWETKVGFYAKWQGRPLRDLAVYVRTEMPQTDPGSLTPEEYTAVTAYLLRLTGNPAGEAPLSDDAEALGDIRIDTLPSAR
jgi:mono/diheme cytochrome c family protein